MQIPYNTITFQCHAILYIHFIQNHAIWRSIPCVCKTPLYNPKFFVFILTILEKLNLECPNVIISSQWQNHESFRANLIWFWSLHCFQKMEKMNISAIARSPIPNDSVGFSGIVFCDLYPTFVRGFFSLWQAHCSAKQVWLPRHAFTCERLLQPPPGAPPSFPPFPSLPSLPPPSFLLHRVCSVLPPGARPLSAPKMVTVCW